MFEFIRGFAEEWRTASRLQRLSVVSDVASMVGLSLATAIGAIALELSRPGRVDWSVALGLVALFIFALAVLLAIHGVIVVYAKGFGLWNGFPGMLVRLVLLAGWIALLAFLLAVGPQLVDDAILK